jgi:hypothetical protein
VTGDHIRQRLAEDAQAAVREMAFDWWCPRDPSRIRRDCPECVAEVAAAALEQTVRDLIAEHLNTAAREIDDWAEDMGNAQPLVQCAVTGAALKVYRRADAVRARTEETT